MNGASARRALLLGLLTLALGPPITSWPRFIAWVGVVLLVLAAPPPKGGRRMALAALAAVVAWGGRHAVPALRLEEAHGHFLPDPAAIVRDWLPPPILDALDEQFRTRYPAEYGCRAETDGCWRNHLPLRTPFAFSADAVFRERRYTRVVSEFDFRDLGELRAGFTNEAATNWWDRSSDVRRRDMPFYVMYVLPAEASGSSVCWRGHVFWEGTGGWQDLRASPETCRSIAPADAGRRVFGLSVREPLWMRLQPSPRQARMHSFRELLALAGALSVAALVLVPRPRRLLAVAGMAAVGALACGGEALAAFGRYDPIGGGSDGIAYESFAHAMLRSAERGDWAEVLKAGEPSFYFQPGLRYFRAVEKTLFGETNLGYLAVLLLLPIPLLRFIEVFLPRAVAMVLWSLFFLPLDFTARFYWDLRSYVDLARAGLAEPVAHILWVCGAALLLRNVSDHLAPSAREAAWGSFSLSVACILRQNLLISSGAVLALVGLRLWRAQGWRATRPVWLAFAPYLWVPAHNAIFAGRLELTAQMGPGHLTPPGVYLQAVSDLLAGTLGSPAWQRVATHTALWMDSPARAAALVLCLVGLPVRRLPLAHRALALAACGQLAVLLFWAPGGRYSHLAWQLIFVSAVANVSCLVAMSAPAGSRTLPGRLLPRARASLQARPVRLTLAGVGLAIVLLEIGLRIAAAGAEGPEVTVAGERPHFVTRPNSLGFRGGELPGRRDCVTLVTLGGGATESARMPVGETWPGRLQSGLSPVFPCVQVANAAQGGFSTFGVRRLLVELILPARPAAVLLMAGHDDVARERAAPAERVPLWPVKLRHELSRHSALLALLLRPPAERRNVVPSRLPVELAALPAAHIGRHPAQHLLVRHERTYVPAYRARLEEILLRARARGVELVLLTQPALYGDAVDPATGVDLRLVRVDDADGVHGGLAWRILELYNDATRELGREYQTPVIDLAHQLPKDSRLFADFVQLSADGARQAATIVSRELCPSLARRFPRHARGECPANGGARDRWR